MNKHGIALTEIIGGRIYNVVVDSANEAKHILKGSDLQQRVTFMPLKDIISKEVPRDIISKIEELTQGRAKLAIDLIDFDPKFTKVMQQIFGQTFVCEDNETAKKISQGQRAFPCVTLLGDSYRTDGVIGGGANTAGNKL